MPPWGAHKILSIPEIKDVVAFLKTLREPLVFADPQENPATRTPPKDTRDNLDPTENPAIFALDRGKEAFKRVGAYGKSCSSCHATPESAFKT